jgi:hypothetical protein
MDGPVFVDPYFKGFAIWNGSGVGAARVLRCSTLFTKRVVKNFSI